MKLKSFTIKKNLILIDVVDINKILVSNKVSYKKGYKYSICYKDYEKIKPLCIMLPQISRRARSFDKTKCMSFKIVDDGLVGEYVKIWS